MLNPSTLCKSGACSSVVIYNYVIFKSGHQFSKSIFFLCRDLLIADHILWVFFSLLMAVRLLITTNIHIILTWIVISLVITPHLLNVILMWWNSSNTLNKFSIFLKITKEGKAVRHSETCKLQYGGQGRIINRFLGNTICTQK